MTKHPSSTCCLSLPNKLEPDWMNSDLQCPVVRKIACPRKVGALCRVCTECVHVRRIDIVCKECTVAPPDRLVAPLALGWVKISMGWVKIQELDSGCKWIFNASEIGPCWMCDYKNAVSYLSRQSHLRMVRMSTQVIPFYLEIPFPWLISMDRVRWAG